MKSGFFIYRFIFYFLIIFSINQNVFASKFINIDNVDLSEFPEIKITCSINTIKINDIDNIPKENILVKEDNKPINNFSLEKIESKTKPNICLAILMDSSKSIEKQTFNILKQKAINLVDSSNNLHFVLYRFNDSVIKLTNITSDKKLIISNILKIERHGKRTRLYNCIFEAAQYLNKLDFIKFIIVFTDSKDEGSYLLADDIIHFSNKNNIIILPILTIKDDNKLSLQRISKLTGGTYFNYLDNNLSLKIKNFIYKNIDNNFNNYEIKYISSINDNNIHSIDVIFNYKNIYDYDNVTIKHKINKPDILDNPYIILFITIIIILIIFFICFLIFINKIKYIVDTVTSKSIPEPVINNFNSLYKKDKKLHKEHILTEDNPEYHYSNAWLVEKNGPETGKKFPIIWDEINIGRGKENTIVVDDEAVSNNHMKIKKINNAYYIFDLASDNGTYLNGKKLLRPKKLYDWDEIKIGRTLFIFRGAKYV